MKIAVIILHYGSLSTTSSCLRALKSKISTHQVILVNNTKDDCQALKKIIPGTKLIDNQANLGFAKGVNQGIRLALKDASITHCFLMNNDLSVSFGSLQQLLLSFSKIKTAGIVSPILHHKGGYDWGGKYNKWTGMVRHKNWENKPKTIQSVDHVAGASMLISRPVLEQVGLFDERFFLYYEDLDYCLRTIKAGYSIHINPEVVSSHAVSASSAPFRRTIYQWHSHLQFVTKHLFRLTYPTAYLMDVVIYPLWALKGLL